MPVSVKTTGIRQTISALRRIRRATAFGVLREVATSAVNVQRMSKQNLSEPKPKAGPRYRAGRRTDSPYPEVDTGRLRSSIQIEFEQGGFVADVGSDVFYAKYIELGTKTIPPRPYLGKAWEEEAPRFVKATGRAVKGAAERG